MAFVFVTVVLPTIWKKAVLQKYDQELEDQEKEVEDVEIAKAAIVDGEEKLAEARKLNHAAAIASAEVRLKELYEALEKERAEAEENVDAGKQGKVFAGANAGMAKTLGGKKLFKNEGLAAASELEIEVELTRVEIVECVLQMIDWFTDIQFAISLIIDEHLDVPWWLIVLAFLAAIAGAAHDVVYTRLMAKRSVCRHMMEEAQWATERDAGQDELNRTESMVCSSSSCSSTSCCCGSSCVCLPGRCQRSCCCCSRSCCSRCCCCCSCCCCSLLLLLLLLLLLPLLLLLLRLLLLLIRLFFLPHERVNAYNQ
jgi:hypothetical protein